MGLGAYDAPCSDPTCEACDGPEDVTVPRDAVVAALEYIEYLQNRCRLEFDVVFTHDGPGPRVKPLYEAVRP